MRRRARQLATLVAGSRLAIEVTPAPILAAIVTVAVLGTLAVLGLGVALNGAGR